MQLRHALFTSISVISIFYCADLLFFKYSYMFRSEDPALLRLTAALAETVAAKNSNMPMIRLENTEATLREIMDSYKEGDDHVDNDMKFYKYKLGLEENYWDNKMTATVALEKTNRLNRAQVDQSDTTLVDIVRRYWLHPPSREPYNLNYPRLSDFSMGQSPVVDTILHGKRGGFFVECGALDGETRSNTLFFERERDWHGLLIEAGPGNYRELLSKHRKAWSSPTCLGINSYPSSMMFHKGRNRGRLLDSNEAFDWVSDQQMVLSVTDVQCFPLYTFLMALNRTHIDYLSLDIEGLELQVLETIPFDVILISVITVEFKHGVSGKAGLEEFMSLNGYIKIAEVSRDDNLANDLVFIPQT